MTRWYTYKKKKINLEMGDWPGHCNSTNLSIHFKIILFTISPLLPDKKIVTVQCILYFDPRKTKKQDEPAFYFIYYTQITTLCALSQLSCIFCLLCNIYLQYCDISYFWCFLLYYLQHNLLLFTICLWY